MTRLPEDMVCNFLTAKSGRFPVMYINNMEVVTNGLGS